MIINEKNTQPPYSSNATQVVWDNKLSMNGNGEAAMVRCTDKNQPEWIINYDITSTRHRRVRGGQGRGKRDKRDSSSTICMRIVRTMRFPFRIGQCGSSR